MTAEDEGGFAARMAFALRKDPADDVRRTHVTLWVVVVTLAWAVIVPILVIYGLTGSRRGDGVFSLAAFLTLLGPFTAAVVATRNKRYGLGGAYVVLTLVMVIPAVVIAQAG